jgi:transposase-like protein
MSDETQSDTQALAVVVVQDLDNQKMVYRDYSPEDKYTALAALDINGGNVYRTAIAYDIPYSTLRAWAQEREARGAGPSKLEKERRGSLAAKIEDKLHLTVESITPEVVQRATLSQRGVFIGILTDKLRTLRGEELEPDPAVVLCQILGITREQLPDSLQLEPGEEMPQVFLDLIEVVPEKRPEEDQDPSPSGNEPLTENNRRC